MTTKQNENVKANNVTNNVNESANTESANTESAPTSEQIAKAKVEKKHETEIANRYTLDEPKEVERTKFAGAYVLGVWRVDKTKHTKKDGDKTFFKIYYCGTIYDGYTATEFCDAVGIERKHRDGSKSAPKTITLLDKLQALKAAIEAIGSEEESFTNFAQIVAKKIESEKLENDRSAFVAKYGELLKSLKYIPTAAAAAEYGEEFVKMGLKLGYKFSDTKEDTKSK